MPFGALQRRTTIVIVRWSGELDYFVIACFRLEIKISGDCSFEFVWIEDMVEWSTFIWFYLGWSQEWRFVKFTCHSTKHKRNLAENYGMLALGKMEVFSWPPYTHAFLTPTIHACFFSLLNRFYRLYNSYQRWCHHTFDSNAAKGIAGSAGRSTCIANRSDASRRCIWRTARGEEIR